MAKYFKGILGPFSGLIGAVVGSSWRGIDYMRSRPKKGNGVPSAAQLEQQDRFKLVIDFLHPLGAVISVGYQSARSGSTPMNVAVAYHLEQAVSGVYPALAIDYPKVVLSRGLRLATSLAEVGTATGPALAFEWLNDALPGSPELTDRISFVVYDPIADRFVIAQGVASRTALTYTMLMPVDFIGHSVRCWLYFVSAEGKAVSDSLYLGAVPVA